MRPYHHGNHVRLLQCGGEYFPALERAIDSAQREVRLETYIFADDATGRRIAEAMARAVARGVAVRVVHDGFGSASHIGQVGDWMRGQGIEVAATTPIQHGRQLSLTTGANRAELNLFYGQRGFSVVLVPKRGTHPALGELAKFVAEQAIFSTQAWEAGRSDTDAAPSSETPSAA